VRDGLADHGLAIMVWSITGAESYVCGTGKSMKLTELAVYQNQEKGCAA
jgi:hypothetical protein